MAIVVSVLLVVIQSVCAIFNIEGMMNEFRCKEVKISLLEGWCWCLRNVFLIEGLCWWTSRDSLDCIRRQAGFQCVGCRRSGRWVCRWVTWIVSGHHLRWRRRRFAWRSWGYWVSKWMGRPMWPNWRINFNGASRLWNDARLCEACKLLAANLALGTVFFDEMPLHPRTTLKEMHR